jgi:hypothetical protein
VTKSRPKQSQGTNIIGTKIILQRVPWSIDSQSKYPKQASQLSLGLCTIKLKYSATVLPWSSSQPLIVHQECHAQGSQEYFTRYYNLHHVHYLHPQSPSPSLKSHCSSNSHSTNKHAADLVRSSSTRVRGRLGRRDNGSGCHAAVWLHGWCSVRNGGRVNWLRCRGSVGQHTRCARGVEDRRRSVDWLSSVLVFGRF